MNRRTQTASKLIKKIVGQSKIDRVIDIGARDCALKLNLDKELNYYSIDIFQNKSNSIDLVKDISSVDMSFFAESDIVIALDVLEHIDDMHEVIRNLLTSKPCTFLFCLPSTSHWRFRIHYFVTGSMPGGKYRLGGSSSLKDRHRWLTPYSLSSNMMRTFAREFSYKLEIVPVNMRFQPSWTASILPNAASWASFYILRKITSQ